MNSDNNTIPAPHSMTPANGDQIRVSARLLYPYVNNGLMSFVEYENELRQTAVDLNSVLMGYRVFEDDRGELSLNIKLATHFIMGVSIFPKGAVANVLLEEAFSEAGGGDADCINRLLEKHWKVGIVPGRVQAKALHAFLGCEMAFDDWFLTQKKSQRLTYKRDYVLVADSNVTHLKIHHRDNGEGEIYLGDDAAERLIMATPTTRGKLASRYLRPSTPGSFGL